MSEEKKKMLMKISASFIVLALLTVFITMMSLFWGCSDSNNDSAVVTAGDSPDTAAPLSTDTQVDGSLESADDSAWYSFDAVTGNTYTFDVTLDTLSNATLTIYDTDGATVITSVDISSETSQSQRTTFPLTASWVCSVTGKYYSAIKGGASSNGGTFTFQVNEHTGDTGTTTYYLDSDGDGYGDPNSTVAAASQPTGYVDNNTDCNDSDASVHPGATEVCEDGIDQDCDGSDSSCTTYYKDADGDGYGDANSSTTATSQPTGYVTNSTDCNDSDATIYPGATEICEDGKDQNCDGSDSVCGVYYKDADGDGYGDVNNSIESDTQPTGYVNNSTDCDDTNANIHPNVSEICGDGIDQNCDGSDDTCNEYYRDADADTYGNPNILKKQKNPPPGYVTDNTDCDDTSASINPGATEICDDGVDQNCDGSDDTCATATRIVYRDADGDTYGDPNDTQNTAGQIAGYVTNNLDCDDTDPTINPDGLEICGNAIDEDCDGADTAGPCGNTYYKDADTDTYGNNAVPITSPSATPPPTYVVDNTDCDDAAIAVNPGAAEVVDDGIDNDCDGKQAVTRYPDTDTDTFGATASPTVALGTPTGYVIDNTDCDDTNASIKPTAVEICDNAVDDDCDGNIDGADADCPGSTPYWIDADGDGEGLLAGAITANSQPPGYVANSTDCDDANPNRKTGLVEICDNAVDDDCDGNIDGADADCPGSTPYWIDADGDGEGLLAGAVTANSQPPGYVANSTDCDDANPNRKTGLVEICDNAVDDDCDGNIDGADADCPGSTPYWIDADGDGEGLLAGAVTANSQPPGYVTNSTDCDDTNPLINSAAVEICGNATDEDCSGAANDGCP